jgi:prepilin-type N-terminal cleavage/methylation domain-containing protein
VGVGRLHYYRAKSAMRGSVTRRLLREESGFTLVEVLVTMTIMIVVLSALYGIFDMGLRTFSFGNNKVEAVENARLGLEKMEREIRAAYPYDKGNATPDTHLFDAGTWTATQIKFGNDLDGNWKVQCPNTAASPQCEKISYQVYQPAGSSTYALGRANSVAGTLQPVVEHVDYVSPANTGLKFTYFQRDGTTQVCPPGSLPCPSPGGTESDIGMVRIELRIKVDKGLNDATQTLRTDVALRNRGD